MPKKKPTNDAELRRMYGLPGFPKPVPLHPKKASLYPLSIEDALRAAMKIDPSTMPRPKSKPAKSSKKTRKKR